MPFIIRRISSGFITQFLPDPAILPSIVVDAGHLLDSLDLLTAIGCTASRRESVHGPRLQRGYFLASSHAARREYDQASFAGRAETEASPLNIYRTVKIDWNTTNATHWRWPDRSGVIAG